MKGGCGGDVRNDASDDTGGDDDDYSGGTAAAGAKEALPLRWIPWEVYALVSLPLVEPLEIGRLLQSKMALEVGIVRP